ncbi:hypothetical protein HFP89_08090 [Wenzhouxiangella sp. XN79A]|uniref:hypothetical protein n=1 Tax=Wenzhouxiangella sp. XN79A TaxID=2724193 RepID=UPI00144AB71F|nr:hypothetical protein [Wenzhouxiangella sp. XN79A]NKI35124.1 hypothetical protein [Wenzhouxiangella sp. XN79A]
MKLARIDIRSMPGIGRGFSIDEFDACTNFITGPNGIGKSSVIRALRYLLNPGKGDPRDISLTAEFHDGGSIWTVHRNGSSPPAWERDGRPAEPPPLPIDAIASHLIGVEDLMKVQGTDEQRLAAALLRELQGGFDLEALRNEQERQSKVGTAQNRALEAAETQLRDVEREQAQIFRDQQRLPELEEGIRDAEGAARDTDRLRQARELLVARRELTGLEERRQRLPEGMDRLRGHELTRLDELDERLRRIADEQRERERTLQDARQALASTDLEDERPGAEELDLTQERLRQLGNLEEKLTEQRATVTEARTRSRSARERLGSRTDEAAALPRIDEDSVSKARELVGRIDSAERRRSEYESLLRERTEETAGADADSLVRGTTLLRDWLAAPVAGSVAGNRPPWLGIGIAVLGAAAAAAPGLGAPGWLGLVGAGLVVVGLVLVGMTRPRTTASPADAEAEKYRALQLPQPERWDRDSVRQLLADLDRRLAARKVEDERGQRREGWRKEMERAERELGALETQREALATELGFDPALLREHGDFLGRLHAWQQAVDSKNVAEARAEALEREHTGTRELVTDFLAGRPGVPETLPTRHDELTAVFEELRERCRRAEEAQRTIDSTRRELKGLRERAETEARSRAAVYRDAGLEDGQRRELEERMERLDDWQALDRDLDGARRIVDDRRAKLQDHPELIEMAERGALEDLERRLEDAVRKSEGLEGLKDERARIQERVRVAESRHDRESALAEVRARQEELEDVRERVLDADTWHFLIEQIEDEYRSEKEPPVLEAARDHFRRFTHGQWELDLDKDGDDAFRARDTVQEKWRRPAELSTATRMQLLLALRMAHAQVSEGRSTEDGHGAALPLLIDEALTTSDHERAGVILRNFDQLAAEGRQIIYLAAGDHEHRLWAHATGHAPKRIDLGEIRGRTDRSASPDFEPPAKREIPEPGDRSPADYAKALDVPAIDPGAEPGGIHAFHLLHDELQLLHALMQDWRIDKLGQLESLLESAAAARAIPDGDLRETLRERCRITRDWVDAWRVGRGRSVTRETLELAKEAGALSDRNIEGVAHCAEECGWNAQALLERLEEPFDWDADTHRRLNAPKRKELAELLREQGYVDDREPLTADARRQRVLLRLDRNTPVASAQAQVDWLEGASHNHVRPPA